MTLILLVWQVFLIIECSVTNVLGTGINDVENGFGLVHVNNINYYYYYD